MSVLDSVAIGAVEDVGFDPAKTDGEGLAKHLERRITETLDDSTPSLRNGAFPGFVIDYKQDRRQAGAQIEDWLDALSLRKAKVRQRVFA